jgi:hypothetical protein
MARPVRGADRGNGPAEKWKPRPGPTPHRAAHLAAERHPALDAFHVVRLGLNALDQARRWVQQDTLGHRGHKHDPLFRIRRLLRRGYEHHTQKSWDRMLAGLTAGDDDQQIGRAWIAAPELRCSTANPTARTPNDGCCAGSPTSPTTRSPNCCAWPAPSARGERSSWPTSTPAGCPTDPPKR